MSYTHDRQYRQQQDRVSRYVVLLLVSIVVLFAWGMFTMYSTGSMVHAVERSEQENMRLTQELAQQESEYHAHTRDQVVFSLTDMISYSPADERVRYAQVGDAVYSVLDKSAL